jgi:hypothetical protein
VNNKNVNTDFLNGTSSNLCCSEDLYNFTDVYEGMNLRLNSLIRLSPAIDSRNPKPEITLLCNRNELWIEELAGYYINVNEVSKIVVNPCMEITIEDKREKYFIRIDGSVDFLLRPVMYSVDIKSWSRRINERRDICEVVSIEGEAKMVELKEEDILKEGLKDGGVINCPYHKDEDDIIQYVDRKGNTIKLKKKKWYNIWRFND